jgi:hypothetical protein
MNIYRILPRVLVVMLCVPVIVEAQKLPIVQKVSVRAPVNIKIDGKATEWAGKFQAYNKATDILYTLSNDDESLYLTVKVKMNAITEKILRGGITIEINHTLKKKDTAAVSLTYPVLRNADIRSVLNRVLGKYNEIREAKGAAVSVDDFNRFYDAKLKFINLSGIKEISDETISVYNQDNIKAISRFDKNMAYTIELAVPLKYLHLPNEGANGFKYRIKINGPAAENAPGPNEQYGPPMAVDNAGEGLTATDFWGEYILAKK